MRQLTYGGLVIIISDAVAERLELVLGVVDFECRRITIAIVGYLPGATIPSHARVHLVPDVPWHMIDADEHHLPRPLGDEESADRLNDWLHRRAEAAPDTTGAWLEIQGYSTT